MEFRKDYPSQIGKCTKIEGTLAALGIISNDIEELHPRVRDTDGFQVMRCLKSDVIFLRPRPGRTVCAKQHHGFSYWSMATRDEVLSETQEDDKRRCEQFRDVIRGKRWLDFGTGAGGILDLLSATAAETVAIEIQEEVRKVLLQRGYETYADLESLVENSFDVVTLFHVFEHLADPLDILKAIRSRMVESGKLIIEVPHARDFLISFLSIEAFKGFTFWSDHLVLHTRRSLEMLLSAAGFSSVSINGFQRYPLANHLHWLKNGKPGGHIHWSCLRTGELDNAYASMLNRLDFTDTLIAVAQK